LRLQCLNSHDTAKRTYFEFLLWSHIRDCYTATLPQQVILWVEFCLLSAVLSDVWSHSICRSQHMLYKLYLCQWIKELMLSGWCEEPKYEVQFSEGTIPVSAAFPAYLQEVSEYRAKTFWSQHFRDEIIYILINVDYLRVKKDTVSALW
jgi:hypothetical protein